jgi:hypothetical protein
MREQMKNRALALQAFDIIEMDVIKATLRVLVLWLCVPLMSFAAGPSIPSSSQGPESIPVQLQDLLQKRDFAGYLDLFAPPIRDLEKQHLTSFFDDFKMDSVRLRIAGKRADDAGRTRLFLQAYFQNSYSAIMESWQLTVAETDGRWEVIGKEITGQISGLYKIRIPAERFEHVRSVEIDHQDIRLSFGEAAVFYDNIPGLETALLVVGKGTVRFSPSDRIEQHQMELLYRKKDLEDSIEYAYIRCSDGFMSSHVKIARGGPGMPEVTQVEKDKAASIFSRTYSRSFTIENSMDKELLSFLPQGEEAVFDFKAARAGELTYIFYPFSNEEINLYDRSKDRIISLYSPAAGPEPQLKKFYISLGEKFDVDNYVLDLSYSPGEAFLSGQARISVISRAERLDSLKFRFNPDLEILKIYDEAKRELFYTQDKLRKILYIYLAAPVTRHDAFQIEIYYRGRMTPPPPASDILPQAVSRDQLIFRPRYETFLFTQSGLWYPAPPEEDYFKARLKLVIPPEYKCVATGSMVEKGRWNGMGDVVELEKTGSSVYSFETEFPVKYLAFIVGKFDRPKAGTDPIPIQLFISTEIADSDPALFDQAKDILEYDIRSFGPFPYEKLGIVRRLWPAAGGHSPASFIVLNQVPWRGDTPYPVTSNNPVYLSQWDEYFLAHEIAHQWWGQAVSCATYRDQWLSEGLAQFAAASYIRNKYGEKDFSAVLKKFSQWTEKKSDKGPISLGSRLSFYDFDAYQAIVYDKAALALFMLQDILGDDVFFSGLKEFYGANRYSAARTASFISAMEKVSGRDLKAFFQGWFDSYELPDVRTSWSEESAPDGRRLRIRVTQTKGRFVFPLWIDWTSGGETHSTMAVIDQAMQEVVIQVPGKVDRVRINARREVPGRFS